MKNTLLVIVALLVGGCGKGKETPPKTKVTEPVKELTAEDEVVGEYEIKIDGDTGRLVLLKNGAAEAYLNGKKDVEEAKWSISKEGEIHVTTSYERVAYRINKGSSITHIAYISKEGEREDIPKEEQVATFKKIK